MEIIREVRCSDDNYNDYPERFVFKPTPEILDRIRGIMKEAVRLSEEIEGFYGLEVFGHFGGDFMDITAEDDSGMETLKETEERIECVTGVFKSGGFIVSACLKHSSITLESDEIQYREIF